MYTVIFYGSLVLGLFLAAAAFRFDSRLYWLAGLLIYIASFLGGFSIGLYLLVLSFVFWALAIGHLLKWVRRKPVHYGVCAAIGAGGWFVMINTVDDYWLFLPLWWMA